MFYVRLESFVTKCFTFALYFLFGAGSCPEGVPSLTANSYTVTVPEDRAGVVQAGGRFTSPNSKRLEAVIQFQKVRAVNTLCVDTM